MVFSDDLDRGGTESKKLFDDLDSCCVADGMSVAADDLVGGVVEVVF